MPVTTSARRLVSRTEVAQLLGGISVRTVERLEERGELVPIRIGRRVLFKLADVERWIERRRPAVAAGAAR